MSPSQYFSRLGQQFITALTSHTSEGLLYEVDMRLRPSGGQGPITVTLDTFDDYQTKSAWTWEHMALTRARVVVATPDFRHHIEDSIQSALSIPRNADTVLRDVAEMRQKLYGAFKSTNIWSLRDVRGGVVDAEYITQYLLLLNGNAHPHIFTPSLSKSVRHLCAIGALSDEDTQNLTSAHSLFLSLQGVLRLCLHHDPLEDIFPDELKAHLSDAAGTANFNETRSKLEHAQEYVRTLYHQIITTPYEALQKQDT